MIKNKIHRLLVANRGEIAIRVMRAADELGITTIAVFSDEDRYSLHRFKSDEAYRIGGKSEAVKPYLDIEGIVSLAKDKGVDAIHPGYGFLSESVAMADRCREAGILWVGPSSEAMRRLGDKLEGKQTARNAGVPVIEDCKFDVMREDESILFERVESIGFPLIIKASSGGGGRGMRIVHSREDLKKAVREASNEAKNAFGNEEIFVEKYIEDPKHIEVQLLGDHHGNLIHLFERDCSVQRRFQKVVEVAPSISISSEAKSRLYEYALNIGKSVGYYSAGTVEFLIDRDEKIFFIEVNPRIQVEHTVTEEVTGVDLIRSQLIIAQGGNLSDSGIRISSQDDVRLHRFAIQCRITTEDARNNFRPDYGTIIAYRNAGGFGIRLDEGSSYAGKKISPYFDSLLVKVTSSGRSLKSASSRLERALREFRIRGVKTNIPFLLNVVIHPEFQSGKARVSFIDENPDLLNYLETGDRSTKTLNYLANVILNGQDEVGRVEKPHFPSLIFPRVDSSSSFPKGSKDYLNEHGRLKLVTWLKEQKAIQYTDTTFRDAHQSLLATRVRTCDMINIAEGYAKAHPEIFSMEVWGGATFDVAMRFLQECPWERLKKIRKRVPNILLQMLIRGANAVGYTAYPRNLVERFIEESAKAGIDIFRIFDSLNLVSSLKPALQAVLNKTDSLAEVAICYTSDVLTSKKYNINYYLNLARELEDAGAHMLAIKDMAGLLKPLSATYLISELKKAVAMPIRLHTHDTSSIQSATYLKAVEAGVDSLDVAIGSMSGLTSQPNFNSIVAMHKGSERELPVDLDSLNAYSVYWGGVRNYYSHFESDLRAGTADVYNHEIPGGQYSNLGPQVRSLGLEDKFEEVKAMYQVVNRLFGDIVKVTPSSKVVGDMAIFMVSNGIDENNIYQRGQELSFPNSVKDFFRGGLGIPQGGFPQAIKDLVLHKEEKGTNRDDLTKTPINFDKDYKTFSDAFPHHRGFLEYLSYKLYPDVFKSYYDKREIYGDLSKMGTPEFFYGLKEDEEVMIKIGEGKVILVKYLYSSKPDEFGRASISFELNGQMRRVSVKDNLAKISLKKNKKASSDLDVGAPLQGRLSKIMVNVDDSVQKGDVLFLVEAMKMESVIESTRDGKVKSVLLSEGDAVNQDDCVITFH